MDNKNGREKTYIMDKYYYYEKSSCKKYLWSNNIKISKDDISKLDKI